MAGTEHRLGLRFVGWRDAQPGVPAEPRTAAVDLPAEQQARLLPAREQQADIERTFRTDVLSYQAEQGTQAVFPCPRIGQQPAELSIAQRSDAYAELTLLVPGLCAEHGIDAEAVVLPCGRGAPGRRER